jgi:ferredoxin-NADP reductase
MNPIRLFMRMLDRITMYRTVLYALSGMILGAFVLSAFGRLASSPIELLLSLVVIVTAAFIMHMLMVALTNAPGNVESSLITALILFLILTPAHSMRMLYVSAAISAGAILLKYLVVYRKRHIFNPAALALFIAGVTGLAGVDWWVGSRYLFPVVLVATLTVVMKVRRWEVFLLYIAASSAIVVFREFGTALPAEVLVRHFLSWPTIFFAGIMLTEPLGLPPTRSLQRFFVLVVALLGSVYFSIGPLSSTPELSLLVGNLFTFIAVRPERRVLSFHSRTRVGRDAYEYHFVSERPIAHAPGQYLEWTLPHAKPDARGIRRYFTIVSPPGAPLVSFAVRHVEDQSSFKHAHEDLAPGAASYVTHPAGDFMLRKDGSYPVWIAGGIGITPFMSMMRDAAAKGEHLSATLFNCNKNEADRLFSSELAEAGALGVSVIDVLVEAPAADLAYEKGFLTADMLKRHVPDWQTATYYVSGPQGLVDAYSKLLRDMKIPRDRIVTDYFPGLA